MKTFKTEHLLSNGYLDIFQVDYNKSYYLQSKRYNAGISLVYQYIVMEDGTIYELHSISGQTAGIIPSNCLTRHATQKEIKRLTTNSFKF